MLRFNFDAQAGETPASIAQKRALVAQIMGTARTPQTVGEGFSAIGDGIVANVLGGRAADAEKAGQSSANDTFSQLVASITGQGGASMPQTASDATAAIAGGDFLSGLVQSESGGNWNALNSEGYGGRLQFGDDRLADAAAAGLVPQGTTGAMFSRMSPEQQQAVENWHFNDIEQQAERLGLSQYYGQTIAGVPITPESVKAMAHLGGIGGAQKFITSGGQYNPADSNGTRLSDYGTRFGGSGGGSPQVAQGPDLAMLMEAASNPWLSDSQKSVINSMIAQQMQATDPMRQLQLQAAEQELNAPIEVGGVLLDRETFEPIFDSRKADGAGLINAGNGQIYDPNTQQWITAPAGAEDVPESVRALELRAERAGLEPGTPEYNEFMVSGGRSGTSLTVGPDGSVQFSQGGSGGQKLTEMQGKDIGFYTRGMDANSQLSDLDTQLTDWGQENAGIIPLGLGNYLRNPQFRQAKQAADSFLTALLRKDTGAAITDNEFSIYGPMFLPVPGDDQSTIEQKRRAREVALLAIRSGLGTADAIGEANRIALGLESTTPILDSERANSGQDTSDIDDILKGYGL